jgi:mannose-6-phosphate isomerase-like protein (cupin superfamily)
MPVMQEDAMCRKIAARFVLCASIALSLVGLSAQGGGRGPQPLSTSPFDIWAGDKLVTPGSLGNFGHYSASIQRRNPGAAPETHDGFSHFLMFTSGEGMFTLGGEIVDGPDGKKTVKGGSTEKIIVGAMYHIPIKTVHWVVPAPGSSVTYWVTNLLVPKP